MPLAFVNFADAVLLLIIALFAVIGFKSGLVRMAFRIGSFFAAIILARFMYPVLSGYLKGTSMYTELLAKLAGENTAQTQTAAGFLPEAIKQGEALLSSAAAEYMAQLILNIISFVLVLVLIKLVLTAAEKILHLFASLPVIGMVNRMAGLLIGAAEGFLIVCVLLAAVYIVDPIRDNPAVYKAVSEDGITKYVYDNNPLVKIVLPKEQTTEEV